MSVKRIAFVTQAAPWPANELFGAYNISQARAFRTPGADVKFNWERNAQTILSALQATNRKTARK